MLWNATGGRVPLGDTDMDYVRFGHGERPLVLLPGLSDGLATVRGKASVLAVSWRVFFDRYTVYMFSRRNRLPPGFSIRDMAADQAEAMRRLGLGPACVMGVSQGGMIAQHLAAGWPQSVSRLVIAVSAPRANRLVRRRVSAWIRMAEKGDHRALMIDTAEKSYTGKRLARYRRLYPLLGRVGRPESYDRFLVNARAILGFDATGVLGRISCPTLILGGEKDRIVGAEASLELAYAIAGSRLHIYPGLGHAAYEEAPDFNRRVLAFLTERGGD